MPNNARIPLCPFYKDEKNKSISCEDVYRSFPSVKKKYAWMDMYCDEWDWMRCPYAVDLNEAYARLEKGDKKALEKHEIEALRKELKSISTKLGRAEKRIERQQRKIDELRHINQSFIAKNEDLDRIGRTYLEKWKAADQQLHEYEQKIDDQVKRIVEVYEQRLAYMIETHAPGHRLYEDEIKEWAGDKAFAIIYDRDEYGDCWKVVYKDEPGEDLQEHEQENEVRQ